MILGEEMGLKLLAVDSLKFHTIGVLTGIFCRSLAPGGNSGFYLLKTRVVGKEKRGQEGRP